MIYNILRPFTDLKPFQKAEFSIMLVLAFVIPFYWLAAQYGEAALVTCAVLKVVFEQKFKFNPSQMKWKWVYLVFMATWLAYLVGMIHTENADEGWFEVSKKLGFLLFPLVFLISDMSYLTKARIRMIFYALVAGTLVFFLANVLWASYDVIFLDYPTTRFFDDGLMKLYYVHHTYMSMYATLAFVFCYFDFFNHKKLKVKILHVIAAIMLFAFVILCNSRAGIIIIFLSIIIMLVWTFFFKKETKIGTSAIVIILVLTVGIIKLNPESLSRINVTIKSITSVNSNDRRLVQFTGYKQLLKDKWLFGVGTGDKCDEIVKSYESYKNELVSSIEPVPGAGREKFEKNRDILLNDILTFTNPTGNNWHVPNAFTSEYIKTDAEKRYCTLESVNSVYVNYIYIFDAIANKLNTHNQYFETLLSIGVIGLVLLLGYFIVPIFIMIKNKRFTIIYLIFMLIISLNAIFEAILERQDGIIFFNFFNMLLLDCLLADVNSTKKISTDEK